MAQVAEISEKDFRTVVENSEKPIAVGFFAEWCNRCKSIEKEWEMLEDIAVVKIDVDGNNNVAEKFGVSNVPCTILFEKGEAVKRVEGFRTAAQLKKAFSEH